MPPTNQDYKLVLTYANDGGNDFNNVFYVKQLGTLAGDAKELVDAFIEKIQPSILPILHSSTSLVNYSCINLGDVTDFYEVGLPSAPGLRTGEYMPDYVGFAFRLVRPTRAVRNGRKIFGRISEGDVADGGLFAPSGIGTLLNLLAIDLGSDFFKSAGATAGYRLAIPKSEDISLPGGDPVYVLSQLYPVASAEFVRVSTQNSRKSF